MNKPGGRSSEIRRKTCLSQHRFQSIVPCLRPTRLVSRNSLCREQSPSPQPLPLSLDCPKVKGAQDSLSKQALRLFCEGAMSCDVRDRKRLQMSLNSETPAPRNIRIRLKVEEIAPSLLKYFESLHIDVATHDYSGKLRGTDRIGRVLSLSLRDRKALGRCGITSGRESERRFDSLCKRLGYTSIVLNWAWALLRYGKKCFFYDPRIDGDRRLQTKITRLNERLPRKWAQAIRGYTHPDAVSGWNRPTRGLPDRIVFLGRRPCLLVEVKTGRRQAIRPAQRFAFNYFESRAIPVNIWRPGDKFPWRNDPKVPRQDSSRRNSPLPNRPGV